MRVGAFILGAIVAVAVLPARAQDKQATPTSVEPYYPKKVYAPKVSKKKKSTGPTYEARDKFYDRLDAIERKRRKNERIGQIPQYNNFQYFGHRKPPKKRSPEKMRYCKKCGIRH
jgi:hypothetical protein